MPKLTDEEWTYGRSLTFSERVHITLVFLRLPFTLLINCVKAAFFRPDGIGFQRAVVHSTIRYLNHHISIPEMQALLLLSVPTYIKWAKKMKMKVTVEDLVEGTKIMWIGPKRNDKVVLWVHGGAYIAPLVEPALNLYMYLQAELAMGGCDVGIAVLGYTIIPDAGFPTQTHQLTVAVQHLLATGLHPSNLHIIGDSAGGNIILSFLSHLLHPLPSLRNISPSYIKSSIPLVAPIRGIYLLSPWVTMRSTSNSYNSDAPNDLISKRNLDVFADIVLSHIGKCLGRPTTEHENAMHYLDPLNCPEGWWDGLGTVLDRVLVSAGSEELLRDDIVKFADEVLAKADSSASATRKAEVTLVVQDGGVHGDPLMDFVMGPKKGGEMHNVGSLTPVIVRWLKEGMRLRNDTADS
ncbi:alpha/beta-hydrolase [Agrocybe pediades]|nr:alpha/beta-hydrolase [Agrocybe pediades]